MKRTFILFSFLFFSVFSSDIAVVSMAIGKPYVRSVRHAIENKRNYCKKHGYDLIMCYKSFDLDRHPSWSKIKLIEELIQSSKYQWIFWTDADALFMNHALELEPLIDEKYDMILSKDMLNINLGNFFIKSSAWSLNLLKQIYKEEYYGGRWWEQSALITIMNENPKMFLNHMKIIPQRLINSYLPQDYLGLCEAYKPGDFIIHFAGFNVHDTRNYLNLYKGKVLDSKELLTLDYYLNIYGFTFSSMGLGKNKCYVAKKQRKEFQEELKICGKKIGSILEVGLNTGHTAEMLCEALPDAKFYSVDSCLNKYTLAACEFMRRKYGNRFTLFKKDAIEDLVKLYNDKTLAKFDLIYINGGHDYKALMSEINNCHHLSHSQTIVWINNFEGDVKKAVQECQEKGILQIRKVHDSGSSKRDGKWVEVAFIGLNT